MMNKNDTKNANVTNNSGFDAALSIAQDNEVYSFIDPWGFTQTVIGLAAYRQAVMDTREAWRDSVGR